MPQGVSILIPVLNAEKWLPGFKLNLTDLLKTTPDPVEVICVDNGSEDRTVPLIKDLCETDSRIKLFFAPAGIANALNVGLQNAAYEWIMRHDVDDFSHPHRITFFRNALSALSPEDREQIAIVTSHSVLFDAGYHVLSVLPTKPGIQTILSGLQPVNSFVHGSLFLRRSAVEQAGAYRQNLAHLEDVDLWWRLAEAEWKACGLTHFLYWFRIHPASVSTANLQTQMASASMLFPPEKKGLWSTLDRGAIRQLIWSGKRSEAFQWAMRTIRFGFPRKSDLFHVMRLIFGDQLDRAHGWILKQNETEIKDFHSLMLNDYSGRVSRTAAR